MHLDCIFSFSNGFLIACFFLTLILVNQHIVVFFQVYQSFVEQWCSGWVYTLNRSSIQHLLAGLDISSYGILVFKKVTSIVTRWVWSGEPRREVFNVVDNVHGSNIKCWIPLFCPGFIKINLYFLKMLLKLSSLFVIPFFFSEWLWYLSIFCHVFVWYCSTLNRINLFEYEIHSFAHESMYCVLDSELQNTSRETWFLLKQVISHSNRCYQLQVFG